MKCFECGDDGHMSRSCPNRDMIRREQAAADGKPIWCGECDRRTRLIITTTDGHDVATRCQCHPESHKLPAQFTRCHCGTVIYQWDTAGCDRHQPIGAHLTVRSAPATEPRNRDELMQLAAGQAAESRRGRAVIDAMMKTASDNE